MGTEVNEKREATERAIVSAVGHWQQAPAHIRLMAGAYVDPLLKALMALNEEMRAMQHE